MSPFLFALVLQTGIEVSVTPGTTNPALGEVFTVTVRASGPAGAHFEFPGEIVTDGVELTPGPPTAEPGARVYRAQVFALDESARIPEIVVGATLDGQRIEGRSQPIPLSPTRTIPAGEENPPPAAFAPPVPLEFSKLFFAVHGAWIAAFVAALVLLWRRRRSAPATAVAAGVEPEEEARLALARLAPAHGGADPRGFYIELVRVAKRYLERRMAAPVLEMTSQETLAFARSHAWIEPHAGALRDVASAADLVKFGGKDDADATAAERHWTHVQALVEGVGRRHREFEAVREREDEARRPRPKRGASGR